MCMIRHILYLGLLGVLRQSDFGFLFLGYQSCVWTLRLIKHQSWYIHTSMKCTYIYSTQSREIYIRSTTKFLHFPRFTYKSHSRKLCSIRQFTKASKSADQQKNRVLKTMWCDFCRPSFFSISYASAIFPSVGSPTFQLKRSAMIFSFTTLGVCLPRYCTIQSEKKTGSTYSVCTIFRKLCHMWPKKQSVKNLFWDSRLSLLYLRIFRKLLCGTWKKLCPMVCTDREISSKSLPSPRSFWWVRWGSETCRVLDETSAHSSWHTLPAAERWEKTK